MEHHQIRAYHSGVIAAFVPGYSGGSVTDLHRFPLKSSRTTHSILSLYTFYSAVPTRSNRFALPVAKALALPAACPSSPVTYARQRLSWLSHSFPAGFLKSHEKRTGHPHLGGSSPWSQEARSPRCRAKDSNRSSDEAKSSRENTSTVTPFE